MKIVRGVSRTVWLLGNLAFKFPTLHWGWKAFLHGLIANLQERELSRAPELAERLAPVLFAIPGGFLLVMRRCKPLSGSQWRSFSRSFEAWERVGNWVVPVECKSSSVGILGRRIVAVDYGN